MSDIGAFEFQGGAATATFALSGRFTVIVFPGLDGTAVQDIAAAIGPALRAIFRFNTIPQEYARYQPDAPIPALNTLSLVNQRDGLFIQIQEGASATLAWADLLSGGAVSVTLEHGFTFAGFTGANGTAINDLTAARPELSALFLFDGPSQDWRTNRPGEPAFLSSFVSVDHLQGLFIFNPTAAVLILNWEEIAATP